MRDMFEQQDRGPKWANNGTLQQRIKLELYGPSYPVNGAPGQQI